MKFKLILVSLGLLLAGLLPFWAAGSSQRNRQPSRHAHAKAPRFDILKVNGTPACLSKGRLQDRDYNDSTEVEKIVSGGKDSIPVLIGLLTDKRESKKEVFCYWGSMTAGEIAYTMLMDLFTDSSWQHSTIPEVSNDFFLGRCDTATPAQVCYRESFKKQGMKQIQAKWRQVWAKYNDRLLWDDKERCFKLVEERR